MIHCISQVDVTEKIFICLKWSWIWSTVSQDVPKFSVLPVRLIHFDHFHIYLTLLIVLFPWINIHALIFVSLFVLQIHDDPQSRDDSNSETKACQHRRECRRVGWLLGRLKELWAHDISGAVRDEQDRAHSRFLRKTRHVASNNAQAQREASRVGTKHPYAEELADLVRRRKFADQETTKEGEATKTGNDYAAGSADFGGEKCSWECVKKLKGRCWHAHEQGFEYVVAKTFDY